MSGKYKKDDLLRPSVWHFKDPVEHMIHTWSMRARAQAMYRGEEWTMTDKEYIDLWLKDDQYLRRGRSNDDLCMTRRDPDGAWSVDNTMIMSRHDHYKTCNGYKTMLKAVKAKKEKRLARERADVQQ
jgi:hypothetical protein